MKNKLFAGLSIMLMVAMIIGTIVINAPSEVAMADVSATDPRLVSVNGTGEIKVTPDLAYIDLGVQTKYADAAKAQQENAKLMKAVVDAIKAAGIKAEDIKTTGYNLYQTYDYYENKQSDPYYIANNTVNVKIKDITKVGAIIDTATLAGANTINSIRFTVADDSVHYAKALEIAMANAKNKATAIMKTFGKAPGLPFAVNEVSNGGILYYDYAPAKAMEDMAAGVSTPIESGEITITANVSVSYDY